MSKTTAVSLAPGCVLLVEKGCPSLDIQKGEYVILHSITDEPETGKVRIRIRLHRQADTILPFMTSPDIDPEALPLTSVRSPGQRILLRKAPRKRARPVKEG